MHLGVLRYANLKHAGTGAIDFRVGDSLRKWTVLPSKSDSHEVMASLALATASKRIEPKLDTVLQPLLTDSEQPLKLESICIRHSRIDDPKIVSPRVACNRSLQVGMGIRTQRANALLPDAQSLNSLCIRRDSGIVGWLTLAYGPDPIGRSNGDDFDFHDRAHVFRRLASFFNPSARLTDPLAFLQRMHDKAIRCGTPRQKEFLGHLAEILGKWLDQDCGFFLSPSPRFKIFWHRLTDMERRSSTILLDAVRHAFDAFPRVGDPLIQPGLMLLDRPDRYNSPVRLNRFLSTLEELFPAFQFIVSLSPRSKALFPKRLLTQRLPVPKLELPERPTCRRLHSGDVLLIDIDSVIPNFALMQLSQHFKRRGKKVTLVRHDQFVQGATEVFASCVFHKPSSLTRVQKARDHYGPRAQIGGSGVDLCLRLPARIERLPPDYSIYPILGDRAIGFLTRGCPGRCGFCVVPKKEGKPRQVEDLDDLLQGRSKLILLDDNLLAFEDATDLLEQLIRRNVAVNFNQALDLRYLDEEKAKLLCRLRCSNIAFTRRNYHFGLNNAHHLERVRRKYELLHVTREDNVEFICMYGYNTTLAEDVERFRFLRSLPRAYVFVQLYQPFLGGRSANYDEFFDRNSDRLLDELVRIVYPQNMKSMEKYYRWLAILYVKQEGRIHQGLIDTLFRYNKRHRRAAFIEELQAICNGEESGRTNQSFN